MEVQEHYCFDKTWQTGKMGFVIFGGENEVTGTSERKR